MIQKIGYNITNVGKHVEKELISTIENPGNEVTIGIYYSECLQEYTLELNRNGIYKGEAKGRSLNEAWLNLTENLLNRATKEEN